MVDHDKCLVIFAGSFQIELVVVAQLFDSGRNDCAEPLLIVLAGANPNDLNVFGGVDTADMTRDDVLPVAWRPFEQTFVFDGNGTILWMGGEQVGAYFFVDRVLAVPAVAFVDRTDGHSR